MLIIPGLISALIGVILTLAGRIPSLGRLPGDICRLWSSSGFFWECKDTLPFLKTLISYRACARA
nr:DUF2905 family protein [Geomonas sp. Red32]